MGAENKTSWTKKIIKTVLLSPVNITFAIVAVYFGMKAYSWEPSFTNQIIFFAVLGLWAFWIIARYMVILFVILALAGGGYYMYYQYSTREIRACEEKGGVWNKETKTCEEKVTLVNKVISQVKKLISDIFADEEQPAAKPAPAAEDAQKTEETDKK